MSRSFKTKPKDRYFTYDNRDGTGLRKSWLDGATLEDRHMMKVVSSRIAERTEARAVPRK